MTNSQAELPRRINQFAAHLERLRDRWHARSNNRSCFTIVMEFPNKPIHRALPPGAELVDIGTSAAGQAQRRDFRSSDMWSHYIQFAFEGDWFYMELPNTTISPDESVRLMAARSDFFFLKDRPDSPSAYSHDAWAKLVGEHNPVQKVYQAADTMAAAADMAFIWFSLWWLPTNWGFYARTAYFNGEASLEDDLPLA